MKSIIGFCAISILLMSCKSRSNSENSALRAESSTSSEPRQQFNSSDWNLNLTEYFTNILLLKSGAIDSNRRDTLNQRSDTRNAAIEFKKEYVFARDDIYPWESYKFGYVRFQNGNILPQKAPLESTPLIIYGLTEAEARTGKISVGTTLILGEPDGDHFYPAKGDPEPAMRRYSNFYTTKTLDGRAATGFHVISNRVATKMEALKLQVTFGTISTAFGAENIDVSWVRL